MDDQNKELFKTPNDIKVNVTKFDGEVIINEDCCTMLSIIMKNSGDVACSFFGAHNPEIIKVLEKSLKGYFKAIKKELKKNYATDDESIKVLNEDIPQKDKWSEDSQIPDVEESEVMITPRAKVSPAGSSNDVKKSINQSKNQHSHSKSIKSKS